MEQKELKDIYDENFWSANGGDYNYRSAKKILHIIFKHYTPNSIIDIGCGIGSWLKASFELGIKNIKGVDCNEIPEQYMLIPRKYIDVDNLETHSNTNNIKYDMVVSTEVAEHLDNKYSESFVSTLVSYSDVILFSAAIPYQYGEHHVNCQPPQFWYNIFNKHGYVCFDFRNELMNMWEEINPCYAQNILLFVHKDKEHLFNQFHKTDKPLFFYHPAYVNIIIDINNNTIKNIQNSITNKITIFSLISLFNIDLFSISKDSKYLTITILGIKIVFKKKTRPDQTRPVRIHIYDDYILYYNNSKYKKIQPMLQYNKAA